MLKRAWQRWRPRILVSAVLLTLAGLLATAVFAYLSYRRAATQLILERDRQVALLTAVRLRDELTKLTDDLQAMSRSQSLYLGLTERQRVFLRGASQRLSMFDGGVILMDNTGRVRATVPERWEIMSKDWSNQEFFKALLVPQPPSEYFSSVLNVGPDDSPVIVVSVPVLGENQEMVGVLAGLFRLDESSVSAMYASIVRLRLPGTGNTYIIDTNGRVVYDSGYQRTGQVIDLAAMQKSATATEPEPTLDTEGHQVISSYAPVPGTQWVLVIETDWLQAVAPIQRFATGLIVLLGMGLVVPTLAVVLLARGQRYDASESERALAEMRLGAAIRQRLLPRYTPMLGGWDVAVHHQAAAKGASAHDFYDFHLLPDGRLMISLATIADQGLSAIHLMTTTRASFRAAACNTPSAGSALSLCNNLLCPDLKPENAIASLLALLDPVTGRLQIANAGFCAPFRWTSGELVEMREGNAFLGQALDITFDHDEFVLAPGEAMIFYSPGALGARLETGEPFGPERVQGVLTARGALTANAIVDALRVDLAEFADDDSLRRLDITFLVLSRRPAVPVTELPGKSLLRNLAALGETDAEL